MASTTHFTPGAAVAGPLSDPAALATRLWRAFLVARMREALHRMPDSHLARLGIRRAEIPARAEALIDRR